MPKLFWDIETRSTVSLEEAGAWRYAADAMTEVLCLAFAIEDNEPQIWTPGQPIPTEFFEVAGNSDWCVVAHNQQFERAITTHILQPRFGWPEIPLAQQRCSMALALAHALPGALENAAAALGLPFQKDREGYRLMRLMSRPRRPRKNEDPAGVCWIDDEELRARLQLYCKRDVETERAAFNRLPPLPPQEQQLWELDAVINARGFHVDIALAEAAREVARQEQIAINAEIAALTEGEIVSVNQVEKIKAFVRRHGHALESLTRRAISALLAHGPSDNVRRLLELRRQGARASTRKFDALFASVDRDHRLRGTLRFHASSTGRWSGARFQPQNLKKPETKDLDAAIDAILTGDMKRIRELGAPLTVAGDISRGIVCARPGHVLVGADFSAIESRVLAWLAGEGWKLDTYRKYDETGNPEFEPYCVMASQALKRTVTPEDESGRGLGKIYDLAFGFGGGLGAWRKFDPSGTYSDAEIEHFKSAFRKTHQATVRFWHALERAAHRCVHTKTRINLCNRFSFTMEDGTLFMRLPSGRRLAYPEASLGPGKFDYTRELRYRDNAKGGWNTFSAWYGVLVENAVQATARDLLAAAMLRVEAAGYPIVLTVHDEIVCEVPEGFGSVEEFHRLMTELPDWAAGLPIAAKAWTRQRYVKSTATVKPEAPATSESPAAKIKATTQPINGAHVAPAKAPIQLPHTPPLADLVKQPLIDGKICCPFHDDGTPSLHIYSDHFHCFGCGAHGDAIDWLIMIEGLDRDAAIEVLANWQGLSSQPRTNGDNTHTFANAMRLWERAQPIAGTPAIQYLADVRKIETGALPAGIGAVLRFHPRCPFGPGTRYPCVLALMRDGVSDAPTGIQRIALTPEVLSGGKVERRMLGRAGTVKLWPAASSLVIGEGIETVLAAATRIPYRGAPLQPAWSTLTSGKLSTFPVLPSVERLIILVDHDISGAGQLAATVCTERWSRAGRTVVRLTPERAGADFNDLVMAERVL